MKVLGGHGVGVALWVDGVLVVGEEGGFAHGDQTLLIRQTLCPRIFPALDGFDGDLALVFQHSRQVAGNVAA